MKWFKGLTVLFALVIAATMMAPNPVMAEDKISLTGSTTVLPIAQKAAEDYMKMHKDMNISVAGTGSGDGIKAIIDGMADIGNSSREIKGKEFEAAKAKGVTLVPHTVAMDCIVPIVHPSNPVSGATKDQLKGIFNGSISNWKEIGGEDKPIVVVSRDSSSGTFGAWGEMVLHKDRLRQDAQMQASNGAVLQTVAGNKYAIGYVGLGYVKSSIKPLTVNGVMAGVATAKDKSYPISRALFMITNGEPKGASKDFLSFVMGAEGQKIVAEEGFIPLN
ncbi:MAG: phosphate ABC transporter substrate-binding protein [Proteobacteria bacterium]|nr:phosphate ABC transporter substrate-binding protein [Pseudomonadota bacterium]